MVLISVADNVSHVIHTTQLEMHNIWYCPSTQTLWRFEDVNQRRTDNIMTKRKVWKDKQLSTKHYAIRLQTVPTGAPLKTGFELVCSGRVNSSCSTSDTCHVTLIANAVISREWGKDWIVVTTNRTYSLSFVTQIFCNRLG